MFCSCCLASINLARHLSEPICQASSEPPTLLATWRVDWQKLEITIRTCTRFLGFFFLPFSSSRFSFIFLLSSLLTLLVLTTDDVIDANKYVPSVPKLKETAHNVRRIGLGVMGLADMMYALRVWYGSDESLDLVGQVFRGVVHRPPTDCVQVMEYVRYHCMCESVELAKKRGSFPAIKGSVFDPARFLWEPPTPIREYRHWFGRPNVDWTGLVRDIKLNGIRNAAHTTCAPTGTIGTVTGCEGYGCEPAFALAYTRRVKEANGDVLLQYDSPLFVRALDELKITGDARTAVLNEVLSTGSCQVSSSFRLVFVFRWVFVWF